MAASLGCTASDAQDHRMTGAEVNHQTLRIKRRDLFHLKKTKHYLFNFSKSQDELHAWQSAPSVTEIIVYV